MFFSCSQGSQAIPVQGQENAELIPRKFAKATKKGKKKKYVPLLICMHFFPTSLPNLLANKSLMVFHGGGNYRVGMREIFFLNLREFFAPPVNLYSRGRVPPRWISSPNAAIGVRIFLAFSAIYFHKTCRSPVTTRFSSSQFLTWVTDLFFISLRRNMRW